MLKHEHVQAQRFLEPRVPRLRFISRRRAACRIVEYFRSMLQMGRLQAQLLKVSQSLRLIQRIWRDLHVIRMEQRSLVYTQVIAFETKLVAANRRCAGHCWLADFEAATDYACQPPAEFRRFRSKSRALSAGAKTLEEDSAAVRHLKGQPSSKLLEGPAETRRSLRVQRSRRLTQGPKTTSNNNPEIAGTKLGGLSNAIPADYKVSPCPPGCMRSQTCFTNAYSL
jgi:hypothetical protein